MSFWDNVKKFAQPYADDDYDDYDEDEEYLDDYEEPAAPARRAPARRRAPEPAPVDDYEDAIACGSTMIRVGTAIFGKRNYA